VVDKIKINSAAYKVDLTKNVPSSYDDKVAYPKKINKIKDGQDGYSLFLAIDAQFAKSTEKPR
jgi:hypothetical protein